MNLFLLCPALLAFVCTLSVLYDSIQYQRHIRKLEDSSPLQGTEVSLLSVIIPARNEERHIEAALASVLALDYPNLEIIVLDDRSTDRTAELLHQMSEKHPRLRVITIRALPPGWLGKNYALHLGAEQAEGEYLLFTDADVRMTPDTVSRAVARIQEQNLDHLCLTFRLDMPSQLLAMLAADSLAGLITLFKPWRISKPDSRYFLGAGGFNLVRRSMYARFGGHRPIRLCPVDDILLGKLVKRNGGRQECLDGCNFVTVPWYSSVREMADGLRKNTFAMLDYQISLFLLLTLLLIICQILPFWGLLLSDGPVRLLCGLTVAAMFFAQLIAVRAFALPTACLRWFLVVPYLKLWIIGRAVITTLIQGGIDWRGTFYSLKELKQNMMPIMPWRK